MGGSGLDGVVLCDSGLGGSGLSDSGLGGAGLGGSGLGGDVSYLRSGAEAQFFVFSWFCLFSAGSVTEQYNPSGQGPEGL